MTREEELAKEGWEKKSVMSEPRLSEAVEMYESLGLEVRVESLRVNATKTPDRMALKDERRSVTFSELNTRVNKLANALLGLGLKKRDKLGIVSCNCIEFMEVYLAAVKSGVIVVPLNWRQTSKAFKYILENSDASAIIVHSDFVDTVNEIRDELSIDPARYICLQGGSPEGYVDFEELLAGRSEEEPDVEIKNKDKITLFANAGCALTCPSRICYVSISKSNKSGKNEFQCSQNLKERELHGMVDFPLEPYVKLGFHRFKLLRARPGSLTGF